MLYKLSLCCMMLSKMPKPFLFIVTDNASHNSSRGRARIFFNLISKRHGLAVPFRKDEVAHQQFP